MVATEAPVGAVPVPEWIACGGSVRSVVDGIVMCPDGIFSPWAHCIGCRFLVGADADRSPERSCSVTLAAISAPGQPESIESWGELVIELL